MKKNKLVVYICSIFLLLVVFFFTVNALGIYYFKWQGSYVNNLVKIFPYPAAYVNGDIVRYNDWQTKTEQYKNNDSFFSENIGLKYQIAVNELNPAQRALEDLIQEKILLQLAKQNKISVSQEEIDEAYHEIILTKVKNGENTVEKSLQDIYQMSINDFKKTVIKNIIINSKLVEKLKNTEKLNDLTKVKAENILKLVKEEKSDFNQLAFLYSDDSSAQNNGNIGYVGHNEMLPYYDSIIWQLEKNQVSDLIKVPNDYAQQGYYIIKVEDKILNNNEEEAKISHIYISSDANILIDDEMRNARIYRFVQ